MESPFETIVAPRLPALGAPHRFPVIATVAPVVASIAMWLITGSLFALIFAALGPVTAIAALADARLGARRTARRERDRFDREVERVRNQILETHAHEAAASSDTNPPGRSLAFRRGGDPYRWRADSERPVLVVVGSGSVRSSIRLEGAPPAGSESSAQLDIVMALEGEAATRLGHVLVDARLGIGVVGMPRLTAAVARALAAQLTWALSPRDYWIDAPVLERRWTELLPHRSDSDGVAVAPVRIEGRPEGFRFGRKTSPTCDFLVITAERQADLPSGCGVVIDTSADSGPAIARHPDRRERRGVALEFLSQEEAVIWAECARADAEREGLVGSALDLPDRVALSEFLARQPQDGAPSRSHLAARFCVGARGPLEIDLVAHGPHAVVGGTTGSGKSELLIAWVLALAATHPPELVTFLLVDFKGGATFAPLALLPHTVGIVTDLDGSGARRALSSLTAELAFRERELARARVGDIRDGSTLSRLVIVVDEFAAMLAEHPELQGLFGDIAARGRSLGVHLVLCTQRPSGVVRDSVLANADVRISLRVNNRADSEAVVGTSDAAALPADPRGRAVVALAGRAPELVQIARANEDDVELARAAHPATEPVRKPWCEPLSTRVAIGSLPRRATRPVGESVVGTPVAPLHVVFGLADLPHEQRIDVAEWNPDATAHVLVIGGSRAGKSTTLETIASRTPSPRWLPQSPDAAWDEVSDFAADRSEPTVLLVDDLDSLLARFPVEYRAAFAERFARVLRDGFSRGVHVAAATQRLTAEVAPLAALMSERLMLGHATRHDWVLAGGESSTFPGSLPAGGGVWRGNRVQVAIGAPGRPADRPSAVSGLAQGRPLAIVSARARELSRRLERSGRIIELRDVAGDLSRTFEQDDFASASPTDRRRRIILGDVDEWQSRWGALAALRERADILFDSCDVADYRALSRSRELPPPIVQRESSHRAVCWRLTADSRAERVWLGLD